LGHLSTSRLYEIRDAALQAGLADPQVRPLLFEGVLPLFLAGLPIVPQPAQQVFSDLTRMNAVERLIDGGVPLQIWLENAVRQSTELGPREVLESALDEVAAAAAGEPPMPPAGEIEELNEEIVFEDDTLEYTFLERGWQAGAAVARLRVRPFRGGEPAGGGGRVAGPTLGTGWLVTDQLMMTNHHVVAARSRDDLADLSAGDLRLQGSNTAVEFDVDYENVDGTGVRCAELAAWDAALDYAVLRLADPSSRRPLRLRPDRLALEPGQRVPVNIIQHPMGDIKRVGLRNNLLTHAGEHELRYLTDTRKGSSGSPVLDDSWRVVGLHRSSKRVPVQFQGRTTAVVNVGTPIPAILADLEARHAPVYEEIRATSAGA
jgi:endonuclease G, mitochondrial